MGVSIEFQRVGRQHQARSLNLQLNFRIIFTLDWRQLADSSGLACWLSLVSIIIVGSCYSFERCCHLTHTHTPSRTVDTGQTEWRRLGLVSKETKQRFANKRIDSCYACWPSSSSSSCVSANFGEQNSFNTDQDDGRDDALSNQSGSLSLVGLT